MLIAKSLHHNLSSALGPYVFVGVVGFLKYGHNVSQTVSFLGRSYRLTTWSAVKSMNPGSIRKSLEGGSGGGREVRDRCVFERSRFRNVSVYTSFIVINESTQRQKPASTSTYVARQTPTPHKSRTNKHDTYTALPLRT